MTNKKDMMSFGGHIGISGKEKGTSVAESNIEYC